MLKALIHIECLGSYILVANPRVIEVAVYLGECSTLKFMLLVTRVSFPVQTICCRGKIVMGLGPWVALGCCNHKILRGLLHYHIHRRRHKLLTLLCWDILLLLLLVKCFVYDTSLGKESHVINRATWSTSVIGKKTTSNIIDSIRITALMPCPWFYNSWLT